MIQPYMAVCFDLFDTLVLFDRDAYFSIREQGLQSAGIEVETFNSAWSSTRVASFDGTIRQMSDRYRLTFEKMNLKDDARIRQLYQTEIAAIRTAVHPVDGIQTLICDLRHHDIRIGLISNASCIAPMVLELIGWTSLFDQTVFSFLENLRKPDPEIYRVASRRLGFPVDRIAFVSDGDRCELTGAAAAGMKPIRFDPSGAYRHCPLPPGCVDCGELEILRNHLLPL